MKIKTKLVVAFIIIILVPVVLCSVSAYGITRYQLREIEDYYGIDDPGYESLSDSTQLFNHLTKQIYYEIAHEIETDASRLEETDYLRDLNERLKSAYSFLVFRCNEEITYNGGSAEQSENVLMVLPEYGDYETNAEKGIYLDGKNRYLIKQIDFKVDNGDKCSIFIVTEMAEIIPEVKGMIWEMILAVFIILAITATLLVAWIYSSMLRPLHELQMAANNIANGNLDFTVKVKAEDEIGVLCKDFEEMRKRLKENAEEKIQYDKDSKELISNISHDLKTPVTAVKGYAEGIMDGVADSPERMEKYIKTIYNKACDMEKLIEELTFYSKIDTNRIPYNFAKIHIDQYFRDCVEEMGMDLEQKNIELTYFDYMEKDEVIIADPEQLRKVVNNIIGNSVKYMGAGPDKKGIINIRLKDEGDFIKIEMEDNGKGIAVKDLPYIFERFYRTDASRNSSQGGSGIGLSIVRKIVEDHGGRIWATSKEDTGTVMHMVFRKYQETCQ